MRSSRWTKIPCWCIPTFISCYRGEHNPNLKQLRDILVTFAVFHPGKSYLLYMLTCGIAPQTYCREIAPWRTLLFFYHIWPFNPIYCISWQISIQNSEPSVLKWAIQASYFMATETLITLQTPLYSCSEPQTVQHIHQISNDNKSAPISLHFDETFHNFSNFDWGWYLKLTLNFILIFFSSVQFNSKLFSPSRMDVKSTCKPVLQRRLFWSRACFPANWQQCARFTPA